MTLQLLLDTADPAAWQTWLPSGLFRGVTTNPTLLRRIGRPCSLESLQDLAHQAFSLGARELHLQTWGADVEEALEYAMKAASTVRIVYSPEGD